jgi:hypothetical protein
MSDLRRYDYLLSVLPALEPMGSIPQVSKREFLEQVADAKGPVRTVEIILLSDDLTQYQALLTEEITNDQTDSAILALDKAENEAVLPDFLLPEESTEQEQGGRSSVDALWSRYFHHAASVAKRARSSFLKAWIGCEVGLRNALVVARSHTLELDPTTYLVAPELADKDMDYSHVVSAWSAAANPLAATEVLDKWRWDWLDERGRWYSFSACEIEVYAAKLALLHHWRRILSDK